MGSLRDVFISRSALTFNTGIKSLRATLPADIFTGDFDF
jgi:hypothetical protein